MHEDGTHAEEENDRMEDNKIVSQTRAIVKSLVGLLLDSEELVGTSKMLWLQQKDSRVHFEPLCLPNSIRTSRPTF